MKYNKELKLSIYKIKKNIKKIFIIIFFLYFFSSNIFAENIENIFSDINPDYKYYNQMQTLFNNGIIKQTKTKLFNPTKVLTRDEFIGILEEVNCNKCIQPNVSEDFKEKYSNTSSFFDISISNKYFYCISDAMKKGITTGYDVGHTCDNGIGKEGEKPFCPNNNIRLEEAIAMLFRSAGIFSIEDADKIIAEINSGKITQNLSLDVKPKLKNGIAYSFYGDIKKALNYSIEEYDEFGEKKVSKMLKIGSNKMIYPDKNITKSDFINLAYIVFKTNSCINGVKTGGINFSDEKLGLGTNIKIFKADCNISNINNCEIADFDSNINKFDFYGEVGGVCDLGVKHPDGYRWEFFNETTGERKIKLGKFINNYSFTESGNYNISLQIYDNCGNIGKSNFYFNYNEDNVGSDTDWVISKTDSNFKIKMIPKPKSGDTPLEVKFVGISEGDGKHTFIWEIEGQKIEGKEITYIFDKPGIYDVKLTVTDEKGNKLTTHKKIIVGGDNSLNDKLNIDINVIPDSGELFLESSLKAIVKNSDGNLKYTWYIDGQKIEGKEIKYLFTKPGKYKIVLVVEDGNGNKGQKTVYITVKEPINNKIGKIKIKLTANPITAKVNTNIKFSTKINGGTGKYNYTWYIDGGVLKKDNSSFDYLFTKPGTYKVKLKVEDDKGNVGVEEITIKIIKNDSEISNPISLLIKASSLSGTIPLPVHFKGIIGGGKPSDYDFNWDFGGPTRIGKKVDYSFKEPGPVTVKLTVTNKQTGIPTSSTIIINVIDKDTDGDGVPDNKDPAPNNPNVSKIEKDTDGDGIPDNIDTDDDNDGITDNQDNDDDGDGIPDDEEDENNNGIPDIEEDDDGDGIPNNQDPDTKPSTKPNIPLPKIPKKDTDGDGVPDIIDDCIFIPGKAMNNGCPILAEGCSSDCGCQTGYKCNIKNKTICGKQGICIPKNRCNKDCSCAPGYTCNMKQGAGSCDMAGTCIKIDSCLDEMNGGVGVFGNAICDTCPCAISADFSSDIRICDIIFPAITSPDGKEIFSKGKNFFIK